MAEHAVERSIWIAAPRERVWQAITDPAQMERWFSPGTAWHMPALEVGGKLFTRDPQTGAELCTQIIRHVDPPEHFAIQTLPDASGAYQVTAYALQHEADGTRLTVTHTAHGDSAPADWEELSQQHAVGFGMMLENVRAHVEGNALPYPQGF